MRWCRSTGKPASDAVRRGNTFVTTRGQSALPMRDERGGGQRRAAEDAEAGRMRGGTRVPHLVGNRAARGHQPWPALSANAWESRILDEGVRYERGGTGGRAHWGARDSRSEGGGTRTHDLGIKSPSPQSVACTNLTAKQRLTPPGRQAAVLTSLPVTGAFAGPGSSAARAGSAPEAGPGLARIVLALSHSARSFALCLNRIRFRPSSVRTIPRMSGGGGGV